MESYSLFVHLKSETSNLHRAVLCRLVMGNGKVLNINSMHDFFYEPCTRFHWWHLAFNGGWKLLFPLTTEWGLLMNAQAARRVSGQNSVNWESWKGNYQGFQTALMQDCCPEQHFNLGSYSCMFTAAEVRRLYFIHGHANMILNRYVAMNPKNPVCRQLLFFLEPKHLDQLICDDPKGQRAPSHWLSRL